MKKRKKKTDRINVTYNGIYLTQEYWEKYMDYLDFDAIVAEEEEKRKKREAYRRNTLRKRQERKRLREAKVGQRISKRRK